VRLVRSSLARPISPNWPSVDSPKLSTTGQFETPGTHRLRLAGPAADRLPRLRPRHPMAPARSVSRRRTAVCSVSNHNEDGSA
jgi:hypothetical protein